MKYRVYRFKTNLKDPRPVIWPVLGPYWCKERTDDHSVIVTYLPSGTELKDFWPDATDIESESEDRDEITFTHDYPKPDWWPIVILTLDDVKKLPLKECAFCKGESVLKLQVREDEHQFPRDFWHAKVECKECGANQGWKIVSDMEVQNADPKLVKEVVDKWNERK